MVTVACIPAYNVEKVIFPVVKEIFNYVDKVIVCNDGSTDQTAKKAKEAGAVVISHEKNSGKGTALKSLFNYVKTINYDVLVTIDGDGQFLPEEIPKLTAPITKNESDVVIGYRFEDDSEMPGYRKFGNKVLDKMTSAASELPFKDTQSGFRAYSKKAIDKIKFFSEGFAADSEILVSASKQELKILEEKVTVKYDTGSKTSTRNPVTHSTDVIAKLIELIAVKSPLKFIGIPGTILVIIGLVYSGIVISIFNESGYFSIPSSLIALGSFIIGLVMVLASVMLVAINIGTRR